jgi:CheY-like chemotaxis protein
VSNRILLVEDEANILEAIGFILSRDGWEVLGHGKGETALAEIARVEPDILVLDVMLPGRSGSTSCASLRDEPAKAALAGADADRQGAGARPGTGDGAGRERLPDQALSPTTNWWPRCGRWPTGTRRRAPHAAAGHDRPGGA